jgi:hypothetical protein
MHIAEIHREGGDLAGLMARMRDWLDAHQITPALFKMSNGSGRNILWVEFVSASEAEKFVEAFGVKPPIL